MIFPETSGTRKRGYKNQPWPPLSSLSPQLQIQWHRDLRQVLDLAQALDLTPETPETSVEVRGSKFSKTYKRWTWKDTIWYNMIEYHTIQFHGQNIPYPKIFLRWYKRYPWSRDIWGHRLLARVETTFCESNVCLGLLLIRLHICLIPAKQRLAKCVHCTFILWKDIYPSKKNAIQCQTSRQLSSHAWGSV